jgi:hypothetical protein
MDKSKIQACPKCKIHAWNKRGKKVTKKGEIRFAFQCKNCKYELRLKADGTRPINGKYIAHRPQCDICYRLMCISQRREGMFTISDEFICWKCKKYKTVTQEKFVLRTFNPLNQEQINKLAQCINNEYTATKTCEILNITRYKLARYKTLYKSEIRKVLNAKINRANVREIKKHDNLIQNCKHNDWCSLIF